MHTNGEPMTPTNNIDVYAQPWNQWNAMKTNGNQRKYWLLRNIDENNKNQWTHMNSMKTININEKSIKMSRQCIIISCLAYIFLNHSIVKLFRSKKKLRRKRRIFKTHWICSSKRLQDAFKTLYIKIKIIMTDHLKP